MAVDILTHHDNIRHSGLEGQSSIIARGLLVLAACRLHQILLHPPPSHDMDKRLLADIAESCSFSDIREHTLQPRFCSVLCDTTSNQDTLMNCGGLVIPMGGFSLYVSFSHTRTKSLLHKQPFRATTSAPHVAMCPGRLSSDPPISTTTYTVRGKAPWKSKTASMASSTS